LDEKDALTMSPLHNEYALDLERYLCCATRGEWILRRRWIVMLCVKTVSNQSDRPMNDSFTFEFRSDSFAIRIVYKTSDEIV
jgi:hypothetical protein